MKVLHSIQQLLFEHDCVIIPGFGGLITNTQEAFFNQEQQIFFPQSKTLVFNQSLKSNDGLLANHLAENQSISYGEALQEIQNYTAQVQQYLARDKRHELTGIGAFTLNNEGKLIFQPAQLQNFHPHSYGLLPLKVKAIEKLPAAAPVAVPVTPNRLRKTAAEDRPAIAPAKRKHRKPVLYFTGITACTLIAVFSVLFLKNGGNGQFHFSSLNPFSIDSSIKPAEKSDVEIAKTPVTPVETPAVDTVSTAPEQVPVVETLPEKPIPATIEKVAVAVNADSSFHIIVGAFSVEKNAENMVQQLKKDGYDARIVHNEGSSLVRVSIEKHLQRRQAERRTETFQVSYHPHAWVLAMPEK